MDWIEEKRREQGLPRAAFSYSIERENILKGFVLMIPWWSSGNGEFLARLCGGLFEAEGAFFSFLFTVVNFNRW